MAGQAVRFIHGFRLGDAPAPVIRHAKRSLLDLIGVAAAGSRLPASRIVRDVAAASFGGGGSRFFFDGRSASPAGAALANATTIDAFDAHDGHPLTKGHAGCGVLAGLAAFAGTGASMSGEDFLGSLIVGYEVAIRAGIALHQTASDYHTSGAWVALGVAAVGARVLGLDEARTREALGIAEYHGPRSQMMRCIDHPTMVKDGSGWGAMAGVMAGLLAKEGFTGAPAISMEAEEVGDLWSDLGSRWRIGEQYLKPWPVCRWAQPAMEAAAQLRSEHRFSHEDVEAITVRTFLEAARLAVAEPKTTEEAQYSLPFPLAALIARGRVGPAEIDGEALSAQDVRSLSRKVRLVEEARYSSRFPAERWADVTVRLKDGRELASQPATARGSCENPLSDGEVSEKFHELMTAGGVAGRARAIEGMVAEIEILGSVTLLLDLLAASPVADAGAAA